MGVGGFHCCSNNNLKSTVYLEPEEHKPDPETSRDNKLKVSRIVTPTTVKEGIFIPEIQKIASNEKFGDDEFNKNFAQLKQNSVKKSCNSN